MSQWYCQLGGSPAGPFSRDELDYLAGRGQLTAVTQVRAADERNWKSAAEVLTDLFPPAKTSSQPVAIEPATIPAPVARQPVATPQAPPTAHQTGSDESEAERRRRQVLLGIGIGTLTAILIFLLLLLLLTFGGFGRGFGGDGTGAGTGSGSGAGSGSGVGAGSGSGTGGGSGAGVGAQTGVGAPRAGDAGQPTGNLGPDAAGTGNASDAPPAPPEDSGIARFTEQPPIASSQPAAPATGGLLGPGGGGGADPAGLMGLNRSGNKVVYVIDCSSSMDGPSQNGRRLEVAKRELIDSLKRLRREQSAYIFFFASRSYPMFGPHNPVETKLLKCTPANVQLMEDWITNFSESGGTQPRESLLAALALQPDVIFFLTDGGFARQAADDVRTKNHEGGKVVSINTICFAERAGEAVMQQIASENNGDYKFVP